MHFVWDSAKEQANLAHKEGGFHDHAAGLR
jgi:hypothetical protein